MKRRVFCIAGLVTALLGLVSASGRAQEKNVVGLVIGATIKGDLQHNVVFTGGLLIKIGEPRDAVVSPERSRNF